MSRILPQVCAAICTGAMLALAVTFATEARGAAKRPIANSKPAQWHSVETRNFRIYAYGAPAVAPQVAEQCEALRTQVARHWFDDDDPQWTPKCTLVLHRNVKSYRAAVGRLADCTVASCKIDAVGTTTTERRIDARADHPRWLEFLPHELTHLLFDGRLTLGTLPRWADEGMALVADPDGKRAAHQRDLRAALASGQQFRMVELLALSDYPRDERLAAFYGQSLSVVQFLIDRGGRRKFVEFVGSATVDGYEAALHASYGIGSIADLERQWLKQVGTAVEQHPGVSSNETAPTINDSPRTLVAEREQSARSDVTRWRRRLRVTRSTARGGMRRS